jgi:hypothetical protein
MTNPALKYISKLILLSIVLLTINNVQSKTIEDLDSIAKEE